MKTTRKFLAILMVISMILSLGVLGASAATITIAANSNSPTAGHTYEVYQIFTGTLNDTTLSDVKYGINYTPGEATINDLVPESELDAITDARAFANDLVDNNKLEGNPIDTLSGDKLTTENLTDGYYLIVDKGGHDMAEGDALSAYIVEVINSVTVNPKSETTSSDKVISSDDYADNNGSDDSITTDGKTSNGGVGSTVNFTLTVNVPTNASGYSYYYCVLNDTLSSGLTFDPTSVVVKVGNKTLTPNEDYILYTDTQAEGKTFQVAMLNAKSLAGQTITVTYSATINENAVIGVEGNPNTFDVDYSNNPEHAYEDKNNNGKPDDETNTPTGTTPEKETRTYVTGIKLIKVDENGNVLTGAEFEITGNSVKYVLTSSETFTEDSDGEYWKLMNETYTTEAPRTEDQYVAKTDRDGGYVADETAEGGYREATADELAGDVQLYTKLLANADSYASTETKYKKTVTYSVQGDAEGENTKTFVGADGVVYFSGLGEGVYTITETKTPVGYNTIAPITLTIDWTAPKDYSTETDCTWSATASTVNGNLVLNDEGVFELEIENRAGSNLPETGGIGTAIFYIVGGVMVAAAVIFLVTKKRMKNAEN